MNHCASGLHKRRTGCDEECLRRIAARLCRLNESCQLDGPDVVNATGCCSMKGKMPVTDGPCQLNDDHCDPKTNVYGCCDLENVSVTDACPGSSTNIAADDCCKSAGKPTDDCCRKATTSVAKSIASCEDVCCSSEPFGADVASKDPTTTETIKAHWASDCCGDMNDALKTAEKCVDDCCSASTEANSSSQQVCEQRNHEANPPDSNEQCVNDCCKTVRNCTDASSYGCSRHLQAAFDRFEAVLKTGLCLCRQVQDQLGFNCCSITPDGLIQPSAACSTPRTGAGKATTACAFPNEAVNSVVDTQCSQNTTSKLRYAKTAREEVKGKEIDVERAAAREHVVVRVSGMTCTGCSKKVMSVLTNISGVSNANVIFVSEIAEWDLDKSCSVDDMLRRVEKETGFTLNRVVSGYQHLYVWMSDDAARRLENDAPNGLVSISKGKKGIYELTYNPQTIGARSLLPPDAKLAPLSVDKGEIEGRRRLWNMVASFGASAILTIPVVVLNWAHTDIPERTCDIVSLVLATCVQGIALPEFYVRAIKSLVYSRVLEMDMLVVISITAAYVYSVIAFALTEAGLSLEQGAFFETSSLLITLVILGRLVSAFARMRAMSSVSFRSLQAETATLVQPTGQTAKIDSQLLQFGDIIRVPPHSLIVTDGQVLSGSTAIDESMVTGESTLIRKQAGDNVMAGTINNAGTVDVSLTRLPGENSITEISKLVENAISAKPRIQDLADKLASYFVPTVIAVSLVVFFIWIGIAIGVRNRDGGGAVGLAITYGIAALAVSCPCALGLAVPMVLVIAGGVAARSGVIIKAADATERGYRATDVVFDKTGTLTTGDMRVVSTQAFEAVLPANKSFSLLKSIVEANDHPVSTAVAAYLAEQTLETSTVDDVQSILGAGIQAHFQGSVFKAGNPYWLGFDRHPEVAVLLDQAMTLFCATLDDQLLVIFGLKSSIRDEAAPTITKLRRRHIDCHIVSGDAPKVVEDISHVLGIERNNAIARSSPAEKQKYVQTLQKAGKRVIFVGDGTNDAVAVGQADVGVQIGCASDVTGAVADVVLLGGLDGLIVLLDISKRAFRRIMFNFAWTVIYNVFAILMASGAFVKFRIPPAYAGLGEIASVAPVIIAAVTLTYRRKIYSSRNLP